MGSKRLPKENRRDGEVARMLTAPEGPLGTSEDPCTGSFGLREHPINFFASRGVVRETYSAEAVAVGRKIRVLRKLVSREKSESHAWHLEKHDSFSFQQGAPPAETLVELPAALQIRHAKGDYAYTLFRPFRPPSAMEPPDRNPARWKQAFLPGRTRLLYVSRTCEFCEALGGGLEGFLSLAEGEAEVRAAVRRILVEA
jgi:hypothetical protein